MKFFKLENNLVTTYSVYNGRESVSFMGPKIRKLVPPAFKQIKSLSEFKKAIKEWKPSNCSCRLC